MDISNMSESANGEAGQIDDTRTDNELVPQLSHLGITQNDLTTCIKVLDAMSTLDPKHTKKRKANTSPDETEQPANNEQLDGLLQFKQPNLRLFRKALSSCLSLHEQCKYEGKSESQYYEDRLQERTLKRQKMAEKVSLTLNFIFINLI